jgi:hypothetical protein
VGTAIILGIVMYYVIYYLDVIQIMRTAREKKLEEKKLEKEYIRKN